MDTIAVIVLFIDDIFEFQFVKKIDKTKVTQIYR